jgi:ubiquinone biosynthesis protein COQ9
LSTVPGAPATAASEPAPVIIDIDAVRVEATADNTNADSADADADAAAARAAAARAAAEEEDDALKQRILTRALTHVPDYGWSDEALMHALAEEGLAATAFGMFPKGAADLVEHFVAGANAATIDRIQDHPEFDTMRTPDLLKAAIKMRLEYNIPYLPRLSQSLAVALRPDALLPLASHVGWLVDDLWHLAGDKSTDSTWYTKRATLGAVYVSAELYMIGDKSPGFKNTWAFLDRRMHVRPQHVSHFYPFPLPSFLRLSH